MSNKKNTGSVKRKYNPKKRIFIRVIGIYSLFLLVAFIFSIIFPSESKNGNIAFFVGVAGTLASLYSIMISAKDEERSRIEKIENQAFIDEISGKIDFLMSDTIDVKSKLESFHNEYQQFSSAYFEKNQATDIETEDNTPEDGPISKDDWEKPDDEKLPT